MASAMPKPQAAVHARSMTSRNVVCAYANIPYAHEELAGRPGSRPFFDRSTVQWQNVNTAAKNTSSATGNAATIGLFGTISVTLPETSTCMGIASGMEP